jgi:hypothetical protein
MKNVKLFLPALAAVGPDLADLGPVSRTILSVPRRKTFWQTEHFRDWPALQDGLAHQM